MLGEKIIRSLGDSKLIGGDFDNRQGAAIRFICLVFHILCITDFESVFFVALWASQRSQNKLVETNLRLKKVKICIFIY